jgi:hypothetical protein
MNAIKWVLKLTALLLLLCTFGWVPVMIYAAMDDGESNFVMDWLMDVLAPIDRVLS